MAIAKAMLLYKCRKIFQCLCCSALTLGRGKISVVVFGVLRVQLSCIIWFFANVAIVGFSLVAMGECKNVSMDIIVEQDDRPRKAKD